MTEEKKTTIAQEKASKAFVERKKAQGCRAILLWPHDKVREAVKEFCETMTRKAVDDEAKSTD